MKTSPRSPIQELRQLARDARSGEFICVTNSVEIHVFLQRGRVAWAMDSEHPLAFVRAIQQRCALPVESFRDVVEECRRERQPLGETLIRWGLASLEDVLAALEDSIRTTLGLVRSAATGQRVFLERARFLSYDERLTFALEPQLSTTAAHALSELPPASAEPRRDSVLAPPRAPGERAAARRLISETVGAVWVAEREGSRTLDSAGHCPDAPSICAAFESTLEEGSDFIAVRTSDANLIAAHIAPEGRRRWGIFSTNVNLGGAIAALTRHDVRAEPRAELEPLREQVWRRGPDDATAALDAVMVYRKVVAAAVLLDRDGAVVAAVGREPFAAESVGAMATARSAVFTRLDASRTANTYGRLALRHKTLASGEGALWCLGAELDEHPDGGSVWVITRRDAGLGVAWACLAAVTRAVATVDRASSRTVGAQSIQAAPPDTSRPLARSTPPRPSL
jgi:hypothetical protein